MGHRRGATVAKLATFLAAMALLAAACSPTASTQASGEKRAEAARAATRALQQAQSRDLGCANVVMSEEGRKTAAPEHLVVLTDAYAVAEACWDKLVFTFEPTGADMPPGYVVEYQKGPFVEGPNGNSVFLLGEAYLAITFSPASQYDERGRQQYLGNLSLRLENMHHTEIVRKLIDDEENVSVTWLVGLDQKRPFTVDAANNPPRVIVYIAR